MKTYVLVCFIIIVFSLLAKGHFHTGTIVGVAILFGIIRVIVNRRNAYKFQKLKFEGKVLQGTIEAFGRDTSIRVNGRHPFIIYGVYRDENDEKIIFESKTLWRNPELYLNVGDPINIYVDRNDYETYVVDVEAAIEQAGNRGASGDYFC